MQIPALLVYTLVVKHKTDFQKFAFSDPQKPLLCK